MHVSQGGRLNIEVYRDFGSIQVESRCWLDSFIPVLSPTSPFRCGILYVVSNERLTKGSGVLSAFWVILTRIWW